MTTVDMPEQVYGTVLKTVEETHAGSIPAVHPNTYKIGVPDNIPGYSRITREELLHIGQVCDDVYFMDYDIIQSCFIIKIPYTIRSKL